MFDTSLKSFDVSVKNGLNAYLPGVNSTVTHQALCHGCAKTVLSVAFLGRSRYTSAKGALTCVFVSNNFRIGLWK